MNEQLSKIWTLFLSRFKVTILFTLFILIWGSVCYKEIPRETEPTIEIPATVITTVWPGASPGDVEKLITNKIEKEIKGLENVEEYRSISLSGVSILSVEFEVESDMTENIQNLREKIDDVKPDLPANIPDDPDLNEVSISDVPILSLTLAGDFSWSELKQFSEVLEDEFEGVPKVKEASVKGAPQDEVHILIDPIKLQAHKIGINEVIAAIRASHRDMPLGIVSIDGQKVEVTVRSELEDPVEFMEIPLKLENEALIKLKEIATVRREFEKFEVETYFATPPSSPLIRGDTFESNGQRGLRGSRGDLTTDGKSQNKNPCTTAGSKSSFNSSFAKGGVECENLQPAVLIDVIKSASKGNVLEMVNQVLGRVEELKQKGILPQNLETSITYNRANDILESLGTLTKSGSQTLFLIALLMFIALGWREAFLAALSIPLALLIAITFLHTTGETFNGISLFALVLSVGLLVDNSIIITEGISSGIHDKKMKPIEAAIRTLKNFRWPIITGTLTTIFAFLPMLFFITGVSGQYISVLPKTVTIVLLGALFVSLFLLPAIAAHFYQSFPPKTHYERGTLQKVQDWYGRKMEEILASSKKIGMVILSSFLVFFFSVWLVASNRVPVEVFPESDFTFFTAKIELPLGTKLEETRKLVDPVGEVLKQYFKPQENGDVYLKNFVFTVGKASDINQDPGAVSNRPQENVLGITINLTEKEDREIKSYEIMPILRNEVEKVVPGYAEVRFSGVEGGPPTGSPIEIRLMGDDLNHLAQMTEQLKSGLENLPNTLNVRDSRAEKNLQLTWKFDRDILARFGLSPGQVLESLRAAVNGVTVVQLTEGDEEIDVDLRVDWNGGAQWDDPKSLDILNQIPLKTPTGEFITFGQVARAQLSSEMSEIEHKDGLRTLFVRADLESGVTASMLEKELQNLIDQLDKLPGEVVEIGGENEEGRRLMEESVVAMGFSLILILVVLVWQFNSFFQPFVTLIIIPLSLTGVFVGFWLSGMTITFPTMIGIVSLAGIIVNDAIVLIDRINQHILKGDEWIRAFIESGKERMQPIFLTSVTTVVGLLPLSLSNEIWGGLGFAIVYGMTLSTVLTLLLIPCFLAVGHRCCQNICRCFEKIKW